MRWFWTSRPTGHSDHKRTKMIRPATTMLSALLVAALATFAVGANAQVPELGVFRPGDSSTPLTPEQSKLFKERRRKQERAVVGQPFPPFLKALDASGKEVTIRDLLRGPSVVIRLSNDSQLSDAILAYLREHGAEYEQQHHVQIVVVVSSYDGDDVANMLDGLPNNIAVLHVTDSLFMAMYRDSVLGGPISPVTLFLDKNLVVTDRHLGTYGEPEETLTSTDAFK